MGGAQSERRNLLPVRRICSARRRCSPPRRVPKRRTEAELQPGRPGVVRWADGRRREAAGNTSGGGVVQWTPSQKDMFTLVTSPRQLIAEGLSAHSTVEDGASPELHAGHGRSSASPSRSRRRGKRRKTVFWSVDKANVLDSSKSGAKRGLPRGGYRHSTFADVCRQLRVMQRQEPRSVRRHRDGKPLRRHPLGRGEHDHRLHRHDPLKLAGEGTRGLDELIHGSARRTSW